MAYKICVIGTGYVGLVSGTTFAETGNEVVCVDIDPVKVDKLNKGIPTIFEPGLEPLLQRNVKEGRLRFTTKLEEGVLTALITFFCLPTPPNDDGSADLSRILEVGQKVAEIFKNHRIEEPRIVVNKSTVPVGTAAMDVAVGIRDARIASRSRSSSRYGPS